MKNTNIKGYDKLTVDQQQLLINTNKRQKAGVGTDYKDDWTPTEVSVLGENLKVVFKNGEWLHYYQNGSWG